MALYQCRVYDNTSAYIYFSIKKADPMQLPWFNEYLYCTNKYWYNYGNNFLKQQYSS